MSNNRIHNLVRAFLDGQLTEAAQQEFYALLKDPDQRATLSEKFMELTGDPDMQLPFDESLRPVLDAVMQADRASAPVVDMYPAKRSQRWIWVAASVLLLAAAGTWFFFAGNKNGKEDQQEVASTVNILPELKAQC